MKFNVTLIQDSPIFFDKEKTLQKVEALTTQYNAVMVIFCFQFQFHKIYQGSKEV